MVLLHSPQINMANKDWNTTWPATQTDRKKGPLVKCSEKFGRTLERNTLRMFKLPGSTSCEILSLWRNLPEWFDDNYVLIYTCWEYLVAGGLWRLVSWDIFVSLSLGVVSICVLSGANLSYWGDHQFLFIGFIKQDLTSLPLTPSIFLDEIYLEY